MSKIAFISDIHANYDALKLVLKDIEKRNVDEIICLGDLVTKYFYPREVVDSIKQNCSTVIKGNCDNLVATDERYKFARNQLGLDNIDYLNNLPLRGCIKIDKYKIIFYHATPLSLDDMFNPLFNGNKYSLYKDKIIDDYHKLFIDGEDAIVLAHTHQNYIGIDKKNYLKLVDSVNISKNRAIVNVGSVGEHIHMVLKNKQVDSIIDPYITYAILENTTFKIIKIPYRDTLNDIYIDMVKRQIEGTIPSSPNDTKRIQKNLKMMGKI